MKRFHPVFLVAVLLLAVGSTWAQNASTSGGQSPPSPTDDADALLAPPPLPEGRVTLVGGMLLNIDRIRNRLTVQPFGSGAKMKMFFDERSRFFRDGREVTHLGIKKGDRVYVDTMSAENGVFARNVRVNSGGQHTSADAGGQVLGYDPQSQVLTMRDTISAHPVSFAVDDGTTIKRGDMAASRADLRPGSLISVRFAPNGRQNLAEEIAIVAIPGTSFRFAGQVTNLDLRNGVLSVENVTDRKTYDIKFSTATPGFSEDLMVGSEVEIEAVFEGWGYQARAIAATAPVVSQQQQ